MGDALRQLAGLQPVIPRIPFCAAEEVVDYDRLDNVVLGYRLLIEQGVWLHGGRQLALAVHLNGGAPSQLHWSRVAAAFSRSCQDVYRAGYEQTVRELLELRGGRADTAGGNRDSSHREVDALAQQASQSYAQSVLNYWQKVEGALDEWAKLEKRSRQLLHNVTLEIVGRSLNLGRSHAATGGARPTFLASVEPALYAMRSEQLDTNTCVYCDRLHGYVTEVGSVDYFERMPPNDCLGRGRCRGIYVYADNLADLRVPGGQQRLPLDPDQLTITAA